MADPGAIAAPVAVALGIDPARVARLIASLAASGTTVAAAESLTGGLLLALLTEVPGSSAVVRGGLVVYATDLKHTLAGVAPVLLDRHGPVHPDVAAQLASGARERTGATLGVGLTGVAGPDPQGGAAVGTVYVALAKDGAGASRVCTLGPEAGGCTPDRAAVRAAAAGLALAMLEDAAGVRGLARGAAAPGGKPGGVSERRSSVT